MMLLCSILEESQSPKFKCMLLYTLLYSSPGHCTPRDCVRWNQQNLPSDEGNSAA